VTVGVWGGDCWCVTGLGGDGGGDCRRSHWCNRVCRQVKDEVKGADGGCVTVARAVT
jgi:hypothetical protein